MNSLLEQDAVPPSEEYATLALTQNKVAIVDIGDYPNLSAFKWYARHTPHTWYALRSEGNRKIYLHRQIVGFPVDLVDHIDGDGLNCRRRNLRCATHGGNAHNHRRNKNNSSGYKGVTWDAGRGMWRAYISYDSKQIFLGRFSSSEEAARAYDVAAAAMFGEFARLNLTQ